MALIHIRHNQELKALKIRALKADALALIPFVGAIVSWRVYQRDSSLDPTRVFESGTEQILEDYSQLVAKKFFYLGASPGALPSDPYSYPINQYKISIPVFDPHVQGGAKEGTREIRAYHKVHNKDPARPTVVIFHANMCTSENMQVHGDYYFKLGYNILMPTMGGYPGSPGVSTTEESSYRDVEAVKLYLQEKKVTKVGYHGLSIGGSLAFQAAVGETAAFKVQTRFVVAEQTFTSAEQAAQNVVSNGVGPFVRPFARGATRACFPQHTVDLGKGAVTKCDGLNNEEKAKAMRAKNIPLFVMKASHDCIMATIVSDRTGAHYEQNHADMLLKTRYGEKNSENIVTLAGEHASLFVYNAAACKKLQVFVKEAMPLPS